jgi:hypothetical protein
MSLPLYLYFSEPFKPTKTHVQDESKGVRPCGGGVFSIRCGELFGEKF